MSRYPLFCKQAVRGVFHLLYPQRCPFCDKVLFQDIFSDAYDVCPECRKKIKFIKEPVCKKCGKPIFDSRAEKCYDCEKDQHAYEQGKALLIYSGCVKESLYRFKYAGRREYADYYGKRLAQCYGNWIAEKKIDAVIPIPLHQRRKKQRGFNQAEAVARVLGQQLNIPVKTNLLKRIKNTQPQKELTNKARKNNLKKAFKMNGNELQWNCILLVDDIYTTGSTIDEAAQEIISSGVRCIYYICIGIGIGRGYEEGDIWR